jgi:NTE family protein
MKPIPSATIPRPPPPDSYTDASSPELTFGLALSGGGSRAIAFHLGCLRALNELGVLSRVKVLSTVSGGSVIGALYTAFDEPFPAFEKRVRIALERGLAMPTFRTAFTTLEGLKALSSFLLVGGAGLVLFVVTWLIRLASLLPVPNVRKKWRQKSWHIPLRRFASRTTIFRRAVDDTLFHGTALRANARKPFLIINAAELRTGSAFYFTPAESGSWRLGRLARSDVRYADAVAASAAYPLFLPALDLLWPFNKRDGSRRVERVLLTDGGVYDNLGIAPLWPDRDPAVSLNVKSVDIIICCRAGYGLRHDPPTHFLKGRLESAFSCVLDRAQNSSVKRLFELRESGKLRGFILPYLGQDDSRLKYPPADLVTREEAYDYPTDFSAMTPDWIERLSRRGEQLTKALWAEHVQTFAAAK